MNHKNVHNDLDEALSGSSPIDQAKLKAMWEASANAEDTPVFEPDAVHSVWDTIKEETLPGASSPQSSSQHQRPVRLLFTRRVWLSVAATFLAGAIGLTYWLQPISHTASPGERIALSLPDGSNVELNSGSTIEFARSFNRSRIVRLEGEAFFDVETNSVPFVVSTFNGEIQVLGTRFNVRAWENSIEPSTTVALEEGNVRFTSTTSSALRYEMSPGQIRQIGSSETPLAADDTVIVQQVTAWRQGRVVLQNVSVGVAFEDIERLFGIKIQLTSEALASRKINLSLQKPDSADEVIDKICSGLGVNYRPTLAGFEIY